MFVGHGLAAFALVAGGARLLGCSRGRALSLGVSAGAFATLPDVDIIYAPVGMLGASGALDAAEEFWAASTLVHRAVTHSLVVGTIAALSFWFWSRTEDTVSVEHGVPLLSLVSLVAVAGFVSGPLGALVMGVFALVGLCITEGAMRYGDLLPKEIFLTALVGLISHPFGDLFTGEPPEMFYPFDVGLVSQHIALAADPTLHLLGTFWLELSTIWLAAVVYCWLTDRRLRTHIHGRAAAGLAYAAAALAVPAPTLASSYQFVFSVLAVGVVGPAPFVRHGRKAYRVRRIDSERMLTAALTGLAAVTLASLAYSVVYVAL
ncbi:MAG TPA: metal-dependent hydrolase [Halococcus sp.]|nr:metal-dependent hydrolase [Halococcus sp.]